MLTIDRSMMLVTAPSIPIGVDVSTPLQAHEKAAMRTAREPMRTAAERKDCPKGWASIGFIQFNLELQCRNLLIFLLLEFP